MTTGITDDEVDLTLLGICPRCLNHCANAEPSDHKPDCPLATGLGTARGDQIIEGERCAGPCRQPLTAGESYVAHDDSVWCVGCYATREAA